MNDTEYLRKRALQELEAAIGAPDYRVRNVHLELSDAYFFRLRQLQAETRRSETRAVDAIPVTARTSA